MMTGSDFSIFVKATLSLYLDAIKLATVSTVKNWPIVVGSIAAYFVFLLIVKFTAPLGMAGGLIGGMCYIALLALYYGWISESSRKQKVGFKDLLRFDYNLFSGLMSVGFVLWIVNYLIRPLGMSPETTNLYACIQVVIFIVFNAVPEAIYIQRYQSVMALKEAANFVRLNSIEWILPHVILLLPLILLSYDVVLILLAQADPLIPSQILVTQVSTYLSVYTPQLGSLNTILGVIIANWFMLFRSSLFKDLESGTRRQRIYLAKQR